jgi:hypothetical protein
MATLPVFSMGESASASKINQAFNVLVDQGNSILDTMAEIQLTTLVDYQRAFTAITARQQRAALVMAPGILLRFVVSDFEQIDQNLSTATIRVDAGVANLRERRQPSQVLIASTSFTASVGTVQAIDKNSTLFSVYSQASIPTGTFTLTMTEVVDVAFLSINIAAMSSLPTVSVSTSQNGITWNPATSVAINGSILNAWLPESPAKYIQVVATPTHADNLGGYTYTFGITDLSGASVDYNLVSDIFFNPQEFIVQSTNVQLIGTNDPNLTYYLTLDDGTPADLITVAAVPGTSIKVPGVSEVSSVRTTTSGVLGSALPGNVIPNTIQVVNSSGVGLPVIPGLSVSDANIGALVDQRVSFVGTTLTIIPHPPDATSYEVSYLTGAADIIATLRVHLSTPDRTVTPIFSGAYLEII